VIAVDESDNKSKPSDAFNIITKDYNPLSKNSLSSILVYPNPVTGDEFYALLNREYFGNVDVEILNLQGVVLFRQIVECAGHLIIIPDLINKNGIYILRIGSQKTFISRKIVINKAF
jgi:hypothetical protein